MRKVKQVFTSRPTIEGAGVNLKRAFGAKEVPSFDPFLLLDDFHSDNPADYIKGFPWHPHRDGEVDHGDSLGNRGAIGSGDVQWMTAGSGIIHQEMPKGRKDGLMWGFQLWANLPSSDKMMTPRYRDIKSSQIPEVTLDSGTKVKIICGQLNGISGPVKDIVTDPEYLDVTVPADSSFLHTIKRGHTAFAYVVDGNGYFDGSREIFGAENLIAFDDGDEVSVTTEKTPVRFLLISGKPIGEPVAWYGPIVMNTQEELDIAFTEYENGTFLKHQETKQAMHQ
jgi:redox-sensitive bicupin YhaK (pirin superfamily)